MGKNDSKFTNDKYHINTMEIIELVSLNIFMLVTKFPHLKILLFCQRRPFQIFGQFRGLFQENNCQNWEFCVEKEREKTRMVKVAKSCHQVTWAQKSMTKKKARINFQFQNP